MLIVNKRCAIFTASMKRTLGKVPKVSLYSLYFIYFRGSVTMAKSLPIYMVLHPRIPHFRYFKKGLRVSFQSRLPSISSIRKLVAPGERHPLLPGRVSKEILQQFKFPTVPPWYIFQTGWEHEKQCCLVIAIKNLQKPKVSSQTGKCWHQNGGR